MSFKLFSNLQIKSINMVTKDHTMLSTACSHALRDKKKQPSPWCIIRINSIKSHDLPITPPPSSVSASHQTQTLIFDRQPCQNVPPGPTNEALTPMYREEDDSIRADHLWLMDSFLIRFVHVRPLHRGIPVTALPPETVCYRPQEAVVNKPWQDQISGASIKYFLIKINHKLRLLPVNTRPFREPCPVCVKLLLMALSYFLLETAMNCVGELCGRNRPVKPVNYNVCLTAEPGHAALSAWTVGLWSHRGMWGGDGQSVTCLVCEFQF